MQVTRRKLGRMASSSFLLVALPAGRLLAANRRLPDSEVQRPADHSLAPEITVDSEEKGKMKATGKSEAHQKKAVTTQYLSDGIDKIGWGRYSRQDPKGYTPFPRDGQMSALIDFKGNWEFSGGFPGQQMYYPCATAVGLALKSSIGKVIAFVDHGIVPATGKGWSFSKHGHSPIVADLWKDVVKGHEFHGHWVTHQVVSSSAGGFAGNVGQGVVKGVEDGLSKLGNIGGFL